MTNLAIISDVHADAHALAEALARIEAMGCVLVVCAGDIVDYGRSPDRVATVLRQRKIPCVLGNHDRWALKASDRPERVLAPHTLHFLRSLAKRWDSVVDGVRVSAHHGTPRSDMDGVSPDVATGSDLRKWLDQAEADVLVVGHTHVPFAVAAPGGGMVVNPGTLLRELAPGQSAVTGGTFGVLELPGCAFRVFRVGDGTEMEITSTLGSVGMQKSAGGLWIPRGGKLDP
jgi:putative phosphoesterase